MSPLSNVITTAKAPSILYAVCCCFLLLVAIPALALEDEAADTQGVSLEMLTAKIKEVESDQDLDDESRNGLIELYRKSVSNLEANQSNLTAIKAFRRSIETAPEEARVLEQELAELEQQEFDPDPGFDDETSTADIAQALLKQRANLSAVEADYKRLKLKLEAEEGRPGEARKELAEANRQQSLAADRPPVAASSESAELKQAGDWYARTQSASLGSEIKKLDQELLSHGPRVDLLKARVQHRKISRDHLKQSVAAIESILGQRRKEEAIQALAMAQAAQAKAEGKHQVLVDVAEENAAISQDLLTMSNKIEEVSRKANLADERNKELDENFRRVRQKLEVAGMNVALGRILQDEREALPSTRTIRSLLDRREREIADISLQQLFAEENLRQLQDTDAAVEIQMKRVDDVDAQSGEAWNREAIAAELASMLEQRRALYEKSSSISSTYLEALSELDFAQRRLLTTVEEYDSFLGERLLWVRSVANPGVDSLFKFSSEVLKYFTREQWRKTLVQVFRLDILTPLLLVGWLASIGLWWKRFYLRERLLETNRLLGNPISDRFSYSLLALWYTLLLSLPWPLALGTLGLKLGFAADHTALSTALADSLIWVSHSWFFILTFYRAGCVDGLAHRHFRWHPEVLAPLRKELSLLMFSFLPISFLTILLARLDSASLEWGIVRLGVIASMAVFALFFLRLLRAGGQVMQQMVRLDAGVLLVRGRRIWLALAIVIPLVLAGLAIAGYVFTALTLLGSFIQTFWVVIALMLVHQLSVRWLRMTNTKLRYQAMQEERKKQFQEMFAASKSREGGMDSPEEPEVDLAHLSRDSMRLVNTITAFVALAGMLVVWSDVLPALGYLSNITLWHYDGVQDGEAVVKAVSLADLGLALVFVGIIYFIYRNLPSLLELFMLQVLSLSASDRYTVTTLTRYFVLAVGIFVVAGMLGIRWSQFQWLAAALGVGIGFGLQEIVANFISGLIILFERPIRVGDRVTVGDVDGIVTRIRIRATTILTWDRQELLVPNKEFITGALLNWSLSDQVSRLVIGVGVAYGSDVTQAMSLIARAAEEHPKVLADPPPFVSFDGFGDNTLNLTLRCYLDDINIRLSTASAIRESINSAFTEAGIVIAFPQRDIHFDPGDVLNINVRKDPPPSTAPESP